MYTSLRISLCGLCFALTWALTVRAESPKLEDLPVPATKQSTPAAPEEVIAEAVVPNETPRLNYTDRRMAICLAIDAQTGIDLANWAAVHGRDPRVKELAKTMAAESMALLKLLDEKTEGRATAALRGDSESSEVIAEPKPRRASSKLNVLNAEKVLMRMKFEIADDSSESLREHLENAPADSVDLTYVGGEVFRQFQMLSTLKVLRKYCSKGFEPLLDDSIKMTERHLATTMAMLRDVNLAASKSRAQSVPAVADTK